MPIANNNPVNVEEKNIRKEIDTKIKNVETKIDANYHHIMKRLDEALGIEEQPTATK